MYPTGLLRYCGIGIAAGLLLGLLANWAIGGEYNLRWQDNSDNELRFVIEQAEIGQPWAQIGLAQANQSSFPISIDDTKLYCWRLYAENDAGKSLPSNTYCLLSAPVIIGVVPGP